MWSKTDRSHHYLVPAAATAEAERLGHAVVDTDHLLLGLLAAGSRDAEVMTREGLTLTALRAAMAQVQREDLAVLLETVQLPAPPVRPPRRPTHATEALPWTPRALAAVREHDDQHVLPHLASAPGPARRLLEHVGVDLSSPAADDDTRPTTGPASRDGGGTTAQAVVAVEPSRLLSTAADASRLSTWYGDCTLRSTTTGAGTVQLDLVDDHGDQVRLVIHTRAHGSGSLVLLTLQDPADGEHASLVRRLLRWLRAAHLRASITSLASAAA